MTKPTSRLDWVPDPVNGRAIRAAWFGSGWDYTIQWGDGTSDRVLHNQPPVRHTYPAVGRYTIVASSGISDKITATAEVTTRAKPQPTATFALVEGTRRVRADLERLDDHVVYLLDWGDGQSSRHDVHDLAPEHEYGPGIGAPTITVHDVPGRRTARFVGPDIPKPPPPEAEPGSLFRVTNAATWRGVVELFGMPPNTNIQMGPAGPTGPGTVVTDESGHASREYVFMSARADNEWQSVSIRWTDEGGVARQRWQPLRLCDWIGGPRETSQEEWTCWTPGPYPSPHPPQCDIPVTIDWNIGAPAIITLHSAPAVNGTWQVAWGDGATDLVEVTNGRFSATHDYRVYGSYWAVVTDPRGKVGRRRLRPIKPLPRTWQDGSLAIFQEHETHSSVLGEIRDCDMYSVMRVDPGDGRPLYQIHRPSPYCPDSTGNGISYAAPGTYQVRMYGPMTDPITYTHVQKTRGIRDGIFTIKQESSPPPITQTFHPDAISQPSRYTAFFTIRNSDQRPQSWRLEFTLAAPAVLTDIFCWRGEVIKTDLGDGRWIIEGTQPVVKDDPTRLDITVDPCGTPRVWPSDVSLSVPTLSE